MKKNTLQKPTPAHSTADGEENGTNGVRRDGRRGIKALRLPKAKQEYWRGQPVAPRK